MDDNQTAIIQAFRDRGASVKPVHTVKGFVDVIVGYRGQDQQVEIKDPAKPPSARKLTKDERDHWDTWRGRPPVIVETEDDVIAVLRGMYQ